MTISRAALVMIVIAALLEPDRSQAQGVNEDRSPKTEAKGDGANQGGPSKSIVDQATGGKGIFGAIVDGVKQNLGMAPSAKKTGHVELGNGQFLTFFEGKVNGYPSQGRPLDTSPPPSGIVPPQIVVIPSPTQKGKKVVTELISVANTQPEMERAGVFVPVSTTNTTSAIPTGNIVTAERSVPLVVYMARGNIFVSSPRNCETFYKVISYTGSAPKDGENDRTDLVFEVGNRGGVMRYDVHPEGATALGKCMRQLEALNKAKLETLQNTGSPSSPASPVSKAR